MIRNQYLVIIVYVIGIVISSVWFIYTPEGIFGKADAIGYAVCHRIPSHSLSIDWRSLPLCARCSGMYLGVLYGTIYQIFFGHRRGGFSRRMLLLVTVFGFFFVIDSFNSILGLLLGGISLYPPQNWLRIITGMGMGLSIATVLCPVIIQTVWRSWKPESTFDNPRAIVDLVAGGFILSVGLLSGYAFILYPLAILSVLSVIVVLTMIYMVLLLMIFKQENRYNDFHELLPVLLVGFVLAITQIAGFDLVRYLLTETWRGLPL